MNEEPPTIPTIDPETGIMEIMGQKYIKIPDPIHSIIEIEGRKYIRVHDFTSEQTIHELNHHYLTTCPPSELIWFMDNAFTLLKQKIVKLEIPNE